MEELLRMRYAFPDVAGRRVLVVGLGGGCDAILACAVAGLFPAGGVVAYGNTKKRVEDDLEQVRPAVFRFPAGSEPPASLAGRTHGTTAIDRALPRGPEGCPFVFVLAKDDEGLAAQVAELGFDLLVGVDTGGDSLTVTELSGENGRDRRMLRVLRRTGLPVVHIVAAPGSDGEAPLGKLCQAFRDHQEHYRGCFALEPTFPVLRRQSAGLSSKRTPCIVLAAAEGRLQTDAAGRVVVPRGLKPAVPPDWLLHGFVFAKG
jgi:hypothetical protein